jgi:hypothetical protein
MVQNQVAAQRDFPLLSVPAPPVTLHIPEPEERRVNLFSVSRVESPPGSIPFARKAVENAAFQFFLVEDLLLMGMIHEALCAMVTIDEFVKKEN